MFPTPRTKRLVAALGLIACGVTACAASTDEADTTASAATTGSYELLGHDRAPRRVVFPLQHDDRGFAARLYGIVREINEAEGLRGDEGPHAAISLVGHISNAAQWDTTREQEIGARAVIDEVQAEIRSANGLRASAAIPGLEIVQTGGRDHDPIFMQDLFEVLARKSDGRTASFLDLTDRTEQSEFSLAKELRVGMRIEAIQSPAWGSDDDDGGNVEVTHEGRPYVGATTSPELRQALERLTGLKPIVLPTSWLRVGHVDEYLTFLPSTDECGGALVYADPLEALSIMWKRKDVPLVPREDLDDSGLVTRDKRAHARAFVDSMRYFLRPASVDKDTLSVADFDRTKPVRDFSAGENVDVEILGNLNAHEQIQRAVAELRRASRCLRTVVGAPSFFAYWDGPSGDVSVAETETTTGYAAVSGYLNLVSLRNHVIVAKEREEFFGPIVRERLATVLGAASRVHEIDATFFEEHLGSVHCATNVVRSHDRWRRSAAGPSDATSCPAGCVASNYCRDRVRSPTVLRVSGLPCVVDGAPGCQACE